MYLIKFYFPKRLRKIILSTNKIKTNIDLKIYESNSS